MITHEQRKMAELISGPEIEKWEKNMKHRERDKMGGGGGVEEGRMEEVHVC